MEKPSKIAVIGNFNNHSSLSNSFHDVIQNKLEEDLNNLKYSSYEISDYRVMNPDIKDGKQKRRERRLFERLNKNK